MRAMIVSVDIQAAIGQRAGVGRFVKCLVEELGPCAGEDALRLFYFDFKRSGVPFSLHGATAHAVRWIPGRVVQKSWSRFNWPPYDWFSGPADVFHFTNFIRPPLTRGRSVVTIYDASFLRFPEAAERKNRAYLSRRIGETVRRADVIVTISEFSRREILELLPAAPDRVTAIYPGLNHALHRPSEETVRDVRRRLALDRPYLLFVGTLEPRKNIPFLIEVFDRWTSFDGDLVLAGMTGWRAEPIFDAMRTARRSARIRHLDFVPEADLAALYAGASLFVFPSLYEGFGFPPLEAMACGVPVVASTRGSLPEVLGDAALTVESFDPEAWIQALNRLLTDDTVRAAQQQRGLRRVGRYTWQRTAQQTWQVYREVAR